MIEMRETWREADEQLKRVSRARGVLDAEEMKWIVVAKRERVHERLGFGSFREYLERRLGYRRHTAIERIRVAEQLESLPAIGAALASSDCSYSAARELVRVVSAETSIIWSIARTAAITSRTT